MQQPYKQNNWLNLCKIKSSRWFLSFFVVFCFFAPALSNAQVGNGTLQLIDYFSQEKINLGITYNELKHLNSPVDFKDFKDKERQNKLMLALIRGKKLHLENFLSHQKKVQQDIQLKLKWLQHSMVGRADDVVSQEKIIKTNALSDLNKKIIELIGENLELVNRSENLALSQQQTLHLLKEKFAAQQRLEQLDAKIQKLDDTRAHLYERSIQLQQKKPIDDAYDNVLNYEAQLLLNNQIIILTQHQISQLNIRKQLIKAHYAGLKKQDMRSTQVLIDEYERALSRLDVIELSLKSMTDLLQAKQIEGMSRELKKQQINVQKLIKDEFDSIGVLRLSIQKKQENKEQQLAKQRSTRQSFSEYNINSWPVIAKEMFQMPTQLYQYIKVLILKISDKYVWLDAVPAILYWFCLFAIALVALGVSRLLRKITLDKTRSRLTGHLYDGFLTLIQRNIFQLTLIAMILVTLMIHQIPAVNYRLLMKLTLVYLTFRILILVARLILLERISDYSGKDVKLYYRLKWLLLMGGWSTALMVFSNQLPLSPLLQDIFNRLFMLFLLTLSLVLWKSKDVIPYLLRPFLKSKKRYVRNAISVLVYLIPLALLTTALIGLIGFINLAWTLSRYQVYFLLVITAYVLARGLIFDALELLSEWMISSLRNGWLWIEVVLKPLDKIMRVLLLLVSLAVLFQLFGWYSNLWVLTHIETLAQYPIVNISGVHITLYSTAEFLILLFFFIWASKWTREFSYRWLYQNARDAGIRNSLSVFTQYAIIMIGTFITLRVLGLDFSGMSMILGGLAVGMGFGLRDFASNIIGGFMLLIERPVREGDLITIGEHEGRVAHIGIRSMRVSSWDNMEVLIPNAETFNKPFTNWTHQDSIVRTVIPIKVGRSDDPIMVQQLILDVLSIIPEVLGEPAPQVFLKQIDEALVEFEVRYFINVQIYTRFEIRSKVLFAITAQFKAAGVKPPIPPLSVEFKDN